jgi:hypothetical protein
MVREGNGLQFRTRVGRVKRTLNFQLSEWIRLGITGLACFFRVGKVRAGRDLFICIREHDLPFTFSLRVIEVGEYGLNE